MVWRRGSEAPVHREKCDMVTVKGINGQTAQRHNGSNQPNSSMVEAVRGLSLAATPIVMVPRHRTVAQIAISGIILRVELWLHNRVLFVPAHAVRLGPIFPIPQVIVHVFKLHPDLLPLGPLLLSAPPLLLALFPLLFAPFALFTPLLCPHTITPQNTMSHTTKWQANNQ